MTDFRKIVGGFEEVVIYRGVVTEGFGILRRCSHEHKTHEEAQACGVMMREQEVGRIRSHQVEEVSLRKLRPKRLQLESDDSPIKLERNIFDGSEGR